MQWSGIFQDKAGRRRWDWHLLIFFLNVFLVVWGYSLRGPAFQAVKGFRSVLVFVSLIGLFFGQGSVKYVFSERKNWVLWIFVVLNLIVVPFSVDFFRSIERLLAWLPFIIYINYFIVYLFKQYSKDEARLKLLQIFNLSYFYPVAILFISGAIFQTQNIYGQNVSWYKTNVIGWACTVFVLTGFDIYNNQDDTQVWFKRLFLVVALLAVWGIVLTGSRSSYVSLAAASAVLVLRSNRISVQFKSVIMVFIFGFAYYIIASPDSVINLRSQYADIRQAKGEIRFELAQKAFEALLKHPGLIFTGFGFDNFRAGLSTYGGVETDLASHNSYLELLFSTGLFAFLFFVIVMAFNALVKYIKFDSQQFIFMPMLLIIPYFESNLNAGQFLFFPWMTFLFFYTHLTSPQRPLALTSH
jgi:O-antigen ligase